MSIVDESERAMSESIVHRGGDWAEIANDLIPVDPFTGHLQRKAKESCRQFGPERPFGETVTDEQATVIRASAKRRGCAEIKGETS